MFQAFRTEQRSNLQPQASSGLRATYLQLLIIHPALTFTLISAKQRLGLGSRWRSVPAGDRPHWWRRRWRRRSRSWRSRWPAGSPGRPAPADSSSPLSSRLWIGDIVIICTICTLYLISPQSWVHYQFPKMQKKVAAQITEYYNCTIVRRIWGVPTIANPLHIVVPVFCTDFQQDVLNMNELNGQMPANPAQIYWQTSLSYICKGQHRKGTYHGFYISSLNNAHCATHTYITLWAKENLICERGLTGCAEYECGQLFTLKQ